jgi:hypothetical protein
MQRAGTLENAPAGAHDAPMIEAGPGESHRRFVAWLLAGAAIAMLAVAAFTALIDPYGGLGTGLFPTELTVDVSVKADLADRLQRPPGVLVLGSSRSLKVNPAYLRRRSGLPAFNAGVRGGTPVEAYAMTRYLHDRFPSAHPHYLWMLDVEAFRSNTIDTNLLNDSRMSGYFPLSERLKARGHALWPLLSWNGARDALHVVRSEIDGSAPSAATARKVASKGFRADGYHYIKEPHDWKFEFKKYQSFYANGAYPSLQSLPVEYLKRTLALMNSWGAAPVIVITPIHPKLQKILAPMGWTDRHRDLLNLLNTLHRSYRFELVDESFDSSWNGVPSDFADGIHLEPSNMRRLTDAVLARFPDAVQ